jgi:hypothetical protein
MHDDSARIESAEAIEGEELLLRKGVDSFTDVDDEWTSRWSGGVRAMNVAAQSERVCPSIALHDANGEVSVAQRLPERVMVAYRGNAAEEIANAAPAEADFFGNGSVPGDEVAGGGVDVLSPFDVVAIGRMAEAWIERQVKVLMRVDQARHDEIAAEVDLLAGRAARAR